MKRLRFVLLALLFLGGTGMVLANTASPKVTKTSKHHKSKKGKKNVAINPQPLPPAKVPINGVTTGSANKTQ